MRKMEEARRHLEEAKKLFQKAVEEFEMAREKKDGTYLSDVCVKGWLPALETTPLLKRFLLYWAWERNT